MTDTLYNELNAYYQTEMMPSNIVQRVSELMRFISKTEVIINVITVCLHKTFLENGLASKRRHPNDQDIQCIQDRYLP